MTTTLGKKGQVVIPQELRRRANLKPGDDFSVSGDSSGRIVLEKIPREPARAKLVKRNGRLVLVPPPGFPPMTMEQVKTLQDGIFE